jgi:molecular chaperone GrpE
MSDENTKNNAQTEAASNETTTEPIEKKSDLQIAQEDSAKWKNEYLYLRAEFENYKKNAIKERSDLLKFGAERIARDVLEVMDNFERALEIKISPETLQSFKTGVELTAKELKEALSKHGIQEVPSHAQPFNPLHHEAISSEATSAVPTGHVSQVFKKPYKLHDKIIRMGQVVVATEPKNASKGEN